MCACIFTIFSFLSQASLAEARVGGGLLHSQGHWVQQCMYGTCWRRCHYLHYLHHSLASGQTTGREQSPTHQQKIGLKIYWAFPNIQAGFRKGRRARDKIANICWITKKAREFQKNINFCFIDYAKPLTVWITINCGKFWKRWECQTPNLPLEKSVCRSGSNS